MRELLDRLTQLSQAHTAETADVVTREEAMQIHQAEAKALAHQRLAGFAGVLLEREVDAMPLYQVQVKLDDAGHTSVGHKYELVGRGWIAQEKSGRHVTPHVDGLFVTTNGLLRWYNAVQGLPPAFPKAEGADNLPDHYAVTEFSNHIIPGQPLPDATALHPNEEYRLIEFGLDKGLTTLALGLKLNGIEPPAAA